MVKIISGKNRNLTPEEYKAMKENVEKAYGNFLSELGYDWKNDPNMEGTPRRVAKMYVDEVTRGTYLPCPKITSFENQTSYDGMVFEGNITVKSLCSHHMQPFIGRCHIAYIPNKDGKVIGLSKLNRIVDWFSRRPQLQEQLTKQIHDKINEIIPDNLGIAVCVEAQHMCVYLRGVEDNDSVMKTSKLSGVFLDNQNKSREEFYNFIRDAKHGKTW